MDIVYTESMNQRQANALANLAQLLSLPLDNPKRIIQLGGIQLCLAGITIVNGYVTNFPSAVCYYKRDMANQKVLSGAKILSIALCRKTGKKIPIIEIDNLETFAQQTSHKGVVLITVPSVTSAYPQFRIEDYWRREAIKSRQQRGDFSADTNSGITALGRLSLPSIKVLAMEVSGKI